MRNPGNCHLRTAAGIIELPDDEYPDDDSVAGYITYLLASGEDWVRIVAVSGDSNQWTVLERDADGIPTALAYREFDGETGVIFS